jgi:1A family penicillin-binding protein
VPGANTQALSDLDLLTQATGRLAPLTQPLNGHKARVASESASLVKARVASAPTRAAGPSQSTAILTRFLPSVQPAKSKTRNPKSKIQNRRKPLFLISSARRRRARGRTIRGGYYALAAIPKPRMMPRPIVWFLGITGAFWTLFIGFFLLVGLGLGGAYWFFSKDLPPVDDLRAIKFETSRIYDRYGNLLYEMYDPDQGKRTYISIDQMPQSLLNATIATEDKSFEANTGVDPEGIVRALYTNFTNQDSRSGASTITQQLVRRVLLPEKDELSLTRKIREALLAMRVTERYSKDKILEIYLNEIYYGSQSYGVAAAADTFWGKKVKDLTLGQSAMLAGLPQTPSLYDPNINFNYAKARQRVVLDLMIENKYITKEEADAAYAEDLRPIPRAANVPRYAPHFVNYVRQVLEDKYGVQLANRGGLKVFTTIDLTWQAEAQKIAAAQIENLKRQNASNASVVAMNARTGEILAMVGSVDYSDPRYGEFNVATSLRQPGSSFKPITYATGFQSGRFTPWSVVPDLPVKYGNVLPYIPQNYDGRFHGPVTIRSALANSFNIPAVEMLREMSVPRVLDAAHSMGITTLNEPERYGLSLTLGGGEVTLLDLTSAYATLANYGYHTPATPFLKVIDADGNVLEELDRTQPAGNRAFDRGVAYQISDILSDNAARTPMFGANSPLKIDGIVAAAKTGTTNDWKDSWTMGYTPALAVGVWVGNNDGRPMAHVAGAIGAAPIWNGFIKKVYGEPEMKSVLLRPGEEELPDRFSRPPDMVVAEICDQSGMAAGPACTHTHIEYFTENNRPQVECDWHQWVTVTLHDGGASVPGPGVPKSDTIQRVYTTAPAEFRGWIGGGPPTNVAVITPTLTTNAQAIPLPTPVLVEPPPIAENITPVAPISGSSPVPAIGGEGVEGLEPIAGLVLEITSPVQDAAVRGVVQVMGHVRAEDFARYTLEFGAGDGLAGMTPLADSVLPPFTDMLGVWNTDGLPPGPYTLRLTLETLSGQVVRTETVVRVISGPPTISITSPVSGVPLYVDDAIDINVAADGGGASLAGVEIYVDGKRIASITTPPWTVKWATLKGTHDIDAIVYTTSGESARAAPVQVTTFGPRPTATPTRAPVVWISNPTLYKEIPAGVGEVWVDVAPGSQVQHVDIYIDGLPGGYATGPGYRVNPFWTPTPVPTETAPPLPTLDPAQAWAATQVAATVQVQQTMIATGPATETAEAQATARVIAANQTATAVSGAATAVVIAATTSPTPTSSPTATATATFVVYEPLLDPMLGDFVARCQFNVGRHRVTAIGYDQNNIEMGRDETWVVVR